jgi:hypothetical protein
MIAENSNLPSKDVADSERSGDRRLSTCSAWSPIDTALKDGSWILAFEPGEYEPQIHVVRWGSFEPSILGKGHGWVTIGIGPDNFNLSVEATHWMPLPSLPNVNVDTSPPLTPQDDAKK